MASLDRLESRKHISFVTKRSKLEGRIDPHPYHFERLNAIKKLGERNELLRLSEVVKSVGKQIKIVSEGDVYVGLENISSNTGQYIPNDEPVSVSGGNVFKKGNVLFPKLRPYLNKVYYAEFDGVCSTEFHVFESNVVLNEFLSIYLRSDLVVDQTKHLMTGNTLPRLQTEDVYKLPVPKTSIDKQRKIVELHRFADEARRSKRKEARLLLRNIDKYLLAELEVIIPERDNDIKSRIFYTSFRRLTGVRLDGIYHHSNLDMFEMSKYPLMPLSAVVASFSSGVGAGKQEQSFAEEGHIQIRPTNINEDGELIFTKNVYLPFNFEAEKLEFDDVLFNNTNSQEIVGKTAIFRLSDAFFYSNHITVLKARKELLNPLYLWAILNCFQKQGIFYAICTNWNNQSGVGIETLRRLRIPVPSLEVQNKITNHITAITARAKKLYKEADDTWMRSRFDIDQLILGRM